MIFDAFKAVFWSFFGVRKRSAYEADTQKLKPQYVIAAALVSALVFIVLLLVVVKLVTR